VCPQEGRDRDDGSGHVNAHASNGGVQLGWESFGTGDPVLWIHGLGYDRRGWGPAPSLLADRFTMITFDNRGVGESDAPAGAYSTAMMAADAACVLDAAGVESAHVLGTSLGGMIAQDLALSMPERVRSLTLSATTPGGSQAYPMPDKSVAAFAAFAADPSLTSLRRLVENSLSPQTVRERPELVEEIYAYRLEHRPELAPWQAQATAAYAFDSLAALPGLTTATLIVHGTDDNVVDYRNSELLAATIPKAELRLVQGTGHLGFWEEPASFAATVGDFLARFPTKIS